MSKVFVSQEPLRKSGGVVEATFDLSPAKEFGALVIVTEWGEGTVEAPNLIDIIRSSLYSYNPEEDYLLLTGSPIIMGLMMTLAFEKANGSPIRILDWRKRGTGAYMIRSLHIPNGDTP